MNNLFQISHRLLPSVKIGDSWLSYYLDRSVLWLDTPDRTFEIDGFIFSYRLSAKYCIDTCLSFMLAAARTLAGHKYPLFTFGDDLLAHLVEIAKGSVRRVNNNLGIIHDEALGLGWDGCDLASWGDRPLQLPDVKRRVR